LDVAGVTSVVGIIIGVVAGLCLCDFAITAEIQSLTEGTGFAADIVRFDVGAVRGASVTTDAVAVVARFVVLDGLDDAISTNGKRCAGQAGHGAFPSIFPAAIDIATVTGFEGIFRIIVFAGLFSVDPAIPAEHNLLAIFARGMTNEVGALDIARGVAPVVVFGVAVITYFARFDDAVSAHDLDFTGLTGGRATVIGFYFTHTVATVTGHGVAVITAFGSLVELTIAAGRPGCNHLTEVQRRIGTGAKLGEVSAVKLVVGAGVRVSLKITVVSGAVAVVTLSRIVPFIYIGRAVFTCNEKHRQEGRQKHETGDNWGN
jgi:hypothetical protein